LTFENYCLASPRKQRLFAVACCRRIWPLLTDERCRAAVNVAERYAEGVAGVEDLKTAAKGTWSVLEGLGLNADPQWFGNWSPAVSAVIAAHEVVAPDDAVADVIHYECDRRAAEAEAGLPTGVPEENHWSLWQDVFGMPRRPVTVDPKWRTANVVELARTIYENEAFERMPLLGDALHRAGCDETHVLEHCRTKGTHIRGCWLLDLLLGRS
jgi:hypothetical protein